eukprot:TRINITY_DN6407_c0_g1_i1.p1 TRINITY_DN6407_c0_g1~~TRINITY_DN6407_c0_g1_i1.p1  ORF type:complete len:125 (+),score=23.25 TRINITY_DN6407_c0_g1_i1:11-385(+)
MENNIRSQLILQEAKTDCIKFVPNKFQKSKCAECGFILHVHHSESIDDEHIKIAIEFEQQKEPANLIFSYNEKENQKLWLGGFLSCTPSFVEKNKITHIIATAKKSRETLCEMGKGFTHCRKKS